jgi:chromosome segregation ATPase
VLKEEEANRLIDEGVARPLDQYFLRPLNDYRYVLRHIRMRLTELSKRIETLRFEKQVLQTAADKTQEMLVDKQGIKLKLEQDFEHFRTERQAIRKFNEQLRAQADAMRAEMKRLHQQNSLLERQIRMQHGAVSAASSGVASNL